MGQPHAHFGDFDKRHALAVGNSTTPVVAFDELCDAIAIS
jgi:hypothetical protein